MSSSPPRCPVTGQIGVCPAMAAAKQVKATKNTSNACPLPSTTTEGTMYVHDLYKEHDATKLLQYIDQATYATLITAVSNGTNNNNNNNNNNTSTTNTSIRANILPWTLHQINNDVNEQEQKDKKDQKQKQQKQKYVLRCHYPQNSIEQLNDLRTIAKNRDEVLLTFNDPLGGAYISPQWLPSKQKNPTLVPTFNFTTVHVKGKVTLYEPYPVEDDGNDDDDEYQNLSVEDKKKKRKQFAQEWIYEQCKALTIKTEGALVRASLDNNNNNNQEQHKPWLIDDAPKTAMIAKIQRLVGIEVDITSIMGKFKLSQDETQHDIQGIVNKLEKTQHNPTMAYMIEKGNIDGTLDILNNTHGAKYTINNSNSNNIVIYANNNNKGNNNQDYEKLMNITKLLCVFIVFLVSLLVQLVIKQ